jgi:hypothetical protein
MHGTALRDFQDNPMIRNMKNKLVAIVGVFLSWSVMAQAGYSQDSGQIAELFTSQNGAIAIRLSNGYKNAIAAGQCPSSDGSWAGLVAPNSSIKAAIMLAKAQNSTVVITTLGCEGAWLKIMDMYVR